MKIPMVNTVIGCSLLLSGCQTPVDSTAQVQQLENRVSSLEKKVEDLAGRDIGQPAPPPAPTASVTPGQSPSASEFATPLAQTSEPADAAGRPLWQTLKFDSLSSHELLEKAVSLGFLPKLGIWPRYASFTDKDDIAPKYRDALTKDYSETESSLKKAFGELKLLHPKKNVRAYEALLGVIGIGGSGSSMFDRLSSEAMGKK